MATLTWAAINAWIAGEPPWYGTCFNVTPDARSIITPMECDRPPRPVLAREIWPGRALAAAITSSIVLNGESAATIKKNGLFVRRMTAVKSLLGSYGTSRWAGTDVVSEPPATNRVYPSGLDRETCCAARTPAAPGLFVTTSGTAKLSWAAAAIIRAAWSLPPPGAKPTTISIGFFGIHSSAWTTPTHRESTAAPTAVHLSV